MSAAWWATAPLRAATRAARASRTDVPRLPRHTVSVGSLALGGRAKTPMVALLASLARDAGLRPAVLSRGYRGGISGTHPAAVAVGSPHAGRSWFASVAARAPELGDESAWLAAVLPGIPVAVHPRREVAAAAVLREHEVDLFLLDGGFQSPVARDVDVVMLDGRRDPPFARRAAVREGAEALERAYLWGVLHADGLDLPPDALAVIREPAGLYDLATGASVAPHLLGPVTVVAGVGDPESVAALAVRAGLVVGSVVRPGDHQGPTPAELVRIVGPVLITEKDAVGWAAAMAPAASVVVLEQRLRVPDQGRLASILSGV